MKAFQTKTAKGVTPTEENKKFELNDEELDQVVGCYGIGETMLCPYDRIDYCPGCAGT